MGKIIKIPNETSLNERNMLGVMVRIADIPEFTIKSFASALSQFSGD